MITLSIIVPVYNKERYLDDTISSILSQTFQNFELILVDDGSTDRSAIICSRYERKDQRVQVITQDNKGVSAARNAGMARASGAFIGFVDADDTVDPDMYELLVGNTVGTNAEISVCGVRTITDDKVTQPEEIGGPVLLDHEAALYACLRGELDRSTTNKIYSAKIARQPRFIGHMYEDILYSCEAFLAAAVTVYQKANKYNHIVRADSVSNSPFNPKYLETTLVSAKIVEMMQSESTRCQEEARVFDVTANISLLNLLLRNPKGAYAYEYRQVLNTLFGYGPFIKSSPRVRIKHKYAYRFFRLSPWMYSLAMHGYCYLSGSDVIKRTKY